MSDIQAVAEVIEPFVKDSMERSNEIIAELWKAGYQVVPRQPKIETSVWEADGETGYLKRVRRKTIGEVYEELIGIVGREGPGHDEYLSMSIHGDSAAEWPDGEIVCFSVNGSSEGDYTHVEVHMGSERRLMFLGKTFDGRDASWAFARQLADIFEELA